MRAVSRSIFSGTLPSGQFLAPDGTAAAPSYGFSSETGLGMYKPAAQILGFSAGGGLTGWFENASFTLDRTSTLKWTDASGLGGGRDLHLKRYAAKQLSITGDGTGATTNAGWILGYYGASGLSGLWSSTVVPSTSNYNYATDGAISYVNAANILNLQVAGATKMTFGSTAGLGPSITAGTATTPVHGFSVTQIGNAAGAALALFSGTWNNAASDTGVKIAITDTSSAAGSLPFQVLGGAAGTTNLLSLSKAGYFITPSTVDAGNFKNWRDGVFSWTNANAAAGTDDTSLSRISAGVVGVGTGAAGSFAGSIKFTGFLPDFTNTSTVGAVTINKAAGKCIVALGATSVVVTNSLVTAASQVICTVASNDATATLKNVVPAAGSFTVTVTAAATADTNIAFLVMNS